MPKCSGWIVLVLCLSVMTAQAKEVVLKIATIAPEGTLWVKTLHEMNKEIEKKTEGEVRFVIYAGMIAGEEPTVVQKVQVGQLDGALFAGIGLGGLMSQVRVLELPFIYRDHDEWNYVYRDMANDLEAEFAKKGYLLLGWTEAGFAYIYSTANPVRNKEDFRAAKVWLYAGDPMLEACFREVGVSGIPLGLSSVVSAMQTGMVNCVYNTPIGLLAYGWHSQIKYCSNMPTNNVLGGFVLSEKAFRKIDDKHREKVRSIAQKHMKRLVEKIQVENVIDVQALKDKYKIEFVEPDPVWVQEKEEFGRKIADSQVGKLYPQELLDRMRRLLQEYRSNKKPKSPEK